MCILIKQLDDLNLCMYKYWYDYTVYVTIDILILCKRLMWLVETLSINHESLELLLVIKNVTNLNKCICLLWLLGLADSLHMPIFSPFSAFYILFLFKMICFFCSVNKQDMYHTCSWCKCQSFSSIKISFPRLLLNSLLSLEEHPLFLPFSWFSFVPMHAMH